jgi:YgiT-type zinc finger domain-containing protein
LLPLKCPLCGGAIIEQEVNHKIKGGGKLVVLKIRAQTCSKCAEQFYSLDSVKKLERIKAQLEFFR